MELKRYAIKHNNNTLGVFLQKQKIFSSKWYMDFGKFGSEVIDSKEKIIYTITKKFKFWKWKMVYTIKNSNEGILELKSQNNRKTIYLVNIDGIDYQLKIHFKKRFSIFKENTKIAEFDESFSDENFQDSIKLQLLEANDLEISFLLYSCIKIGETERNSKAILSSQKQLEINDHPWS